MSARKLFVFATLCLLACAQPALAARLAQDAVNEARQRGSARVLVMLEAPTATQTPASGVRAWANLRLLGARERADSVLMSLPQRGHRVRHRLEPLSLIAMDADAATLERLRTHPLVQRVDLDRRMKKMAGPDPALTVTRVSDLLSVGLDGAGMKAAVIDTGVDTDHTEFVWRLADQACFCTIENSTSGGCCPNGQTQQVGTGAAEDMDGHGTHVASVLLGNGLAAPHGGVRSARLVAVRVFDNNGESCCASDVLAAMNWVATHHPDTSVINLSLGTEDLFPNHCDAADAYTQATQALVARLAAQGTMVVAAAGNDGNSGSMSAPACISNVMSVGATYSANFGSITYSDCTDATTYSMLITCFSNRSATTDIFAPGAIVQGARLGGGATYMAGTSQATPVVAACAVALRQAAPQSTVAQRMDAMTLSPTRITDARSGRGYPFLDCRDAVRLLNPAYFGPKRAQGSQPLIPGYADNQVAMPAAPQPFSRTPVKERPRVAPRLRERP